MKVENGLLLDVPEQIHTDRLLLRCPRIGDGEICLMRIMGKRGGAPVRK